MCVCARTHMTSYAAVWVSVTLLSCLSYCFFNEPGLSYHLSHYCNLNFTTLFPPLSTKPHNFPYTSVSKYRTYNSFPTSVTSHLYFAFPTLVVSQISYLNSLPNSVTSRLYSHLSYLSRQPNHILKLLAYLSHFPSLLSPFLP